MRKIFLFLILSFTGILMNSCDSDFLSPDNQGELVIENFYSTESDAYMALVAAYSGLKKSALLRDDPQDTQSGNLYGFAYLAYGDMCSDDSEKGGGGRGDYVDGADLSEFVATPDLRQLWSTWRDAYHGIYLANLVITHVPEITFAEGTKHLKDQYVAEAKFLRAHFYFYLVRIFGGVPIIDHIIGQGEYEKPRSTFVETYEFIEKDLREAIPFLPLKSQYPGDQTGRITKGAAQAFLAKVLVYESSFALNYPSDNRFKGTKQKWGEALSMAEEVMASGEYNLSTPVDLIFRTANENGPESVFEIQFMESSDGWHNDNTGSTLYSMQRCRGDGWPTTGEGWGFNLPTQDLVNEFEHGRDWGGDSADWIDPRFESTIVYDGKIAFWDSTVTLIVGKGQDKSPTGYLSAKIVLAPEEVPDNFSDAPNNVRIIRYADVVLFAAEAAYYAGDEEKARQYLEMVRARARKSSPNPNALPYVGATGIALRDAIWHERRVELAMESHRFFDLVRQGRAAQVINSYYATNPVVKLNNPFVPGTHELFPIPLNQILVTNGALEQNPGY